MTVATRKKIVLSGLLGVVSAGVMAATGYAASPQPDWIQKMSKPVLHEALAQSIVHNDYDAFNSALKTSPEVEDTAAVSQQQFDALVAAYQLHIAGNDPQAQLLLHHAGITAATIQ